MSERAEALANQFEQANGDFIRSVEAMNDAQWKATCPGEGWPAGVTAHHIAGGHEAIANFIRLGATGQPLPSISMEQLDQMNAQHAQQYANCSKAETVDLLRKNGEAAASTVRGLDDEQLQRSLSFAGNQMTIEQFIQLALFGHLQSHAASIQQAR